MPSFELMTAKVVDSVGGRKLVHLPVNKSLYYEKDQYGQLTVFGKYPTNKAAKAMWRGYLRTEGVHI